MILMNCCSLKLILHAVVAVCASILYGLHQQHTINVRTYVDLLIQLWAIVLGQKAMPYMIKCYMYLSHWHCPYAL